MKRKGSFLKHLHKALHVLVGRRVGIARLSNGPNVGSVETSLEGKTRLMKYRYRAQQEDIDTYGGRR